MSAGPQRMHPADLSELGRLIADHLAERMGAGPPSAPRLLTAAEVAERYGVARSWVYEHADELGAVRLGVGSRGRLRFDPAKVAEADASREGSRGSQQPQVAAAPAVPRRRRRRSAQTSVQSTPELLPIRGRER